jgi:hypothetical protein
MRYPRQLHRNVLLLDGKIINYRIGTTLWKDVGTAFNNKQHQWVFNIAMKESHRLSVDSMSAVVANVQENEEFFDDKEWFKQYSIHEDYGEHMFKPY